MTAIGKTGAQEGSDRPTLPSPSRRSVLKGVLATAGGLAATVAAPRARAAAPGAVTLFTWESYHDDAWLAEFTRNTGIRVDAVRAGSVDEMFARVKSGAVEPDVMILDSGVVPRYAAADMIVPLDLGRLKHAGNIAPQIDYKKADAVRGSLYGVPYNWGTQPLIYNSALVTSGTDTWATLWDPKYRGKIGIFDDAYATLPVIAKYVGAKDPFSLTDAEFEKVAQALRRLRPQVRTITQSFDEAAALYAAGDAVIGICQIASVINTVQDKHLPFATAFPREGTPSWIDNQAVTRKGDRPESYALIDAALDAKWQARFIKASANNGILTADAAMAAGVTREQLARTNILAQERPGFWDGLFIFRSPENMDRRLELWNDFKAGTL